MAPRKNPKDKTLAPTTSLPVPAASSTPSTAVATRRKELVQLRRDFNYGYYVLESDKDDLLEASDPKILKEMCTKFGTHLVSCSPS